MPNPGCRAFEKNRELRLSYVIAGQAGRGLTFA